MILGSGERPQEPFFGLQERPKPPFILAFSVEAHHVVEKNVRVSLGLDHSTAPFICWHAACLA